MPVEPPACPELASAPPVNSSTSWMTGDAMTPAAIRPCHHRDTVTGIAPGRA
ncbi:MAG TPA: hypothetical protein VGP26_29915 [Actinophytocola sp.]|jgi:hypothetical protein|nr:hypothetical protein [Actinophytocola sp.]